MNKYEILYERKTEGSSYWDYASEIIEAKGLMHAQKLAISHLKEMRKLDGLPMRIAKINQVIENAS